MIDGVRKQQINLPGNMKAIRHTLMVLVFHLSMVNQVHSEDVSADQLLDQIESGKGHLKEGMTKIEVANLVGKPFNDSDQNVWIWCFETKRSEKKTWLAGIFAKRGDVSGLR